MSEYIIYVFMKQVMAIVLVRFCLAFTHVHTPNSRQSLPAKKVRNGTEDSVVLLALPATMHI